jgi:hypothetical protein
MKIKGIEEMTGYELNAELQRGGKFVIYQYCISMIILTLKRPCDIYFVKESENAIVKGIGFTLISLLLGWWGIPWGPVYTIQSLITNFRGGKDVTSEVVAFLNQPPVAVRQEEP